MQDIFVGVITCLAGLLLLYGAAANNQFLLDLHKTRWLVSLAGRIGARAVVGLIGIGLIVLGSAIIQGWRLPLFEERPTKEKHEPDAAATRGTPDTGRLALADRRDQ